MRVVKRSVRIQTGGRRHAARAAGNDDARREMEQGSVVEGRVGGASVRRPWISRNA